MMIAMVMTITIITIIIITIIITIITIIIVNVSLKRVICIFVTPLRLMLNPFSIGILIGIMPTWQPPQGLLSSM